MQLTAYCKGLLHFIREHTPQFTKMWLVMRLTMLFLTVAVLQVSARTYSQGITLDMHHAPMEKVLTEIKKQSGYYFIYGKTEIARAENVDVDVKNASLEAVLALIFKGQPLSWHISEKFVMIAPREQLAERGAADEIALLPPGEIRGRITTEKGEMLAGATIIVRGSRRGTLSTADGTFSLHGVKAGDVLVISFTGYAKQEVILDEHNFQNGGFQMITMKASTDPMDELQIIAYGSTTKRLNLGNVTTVKAADIEKQPVDNLILALEGRVPGLQIAAVTNSLPGAAPQVKIRGTNSIGAGTAPLYILDGVPVPETENGVVGFSYGQSALMNINPADIESIEVLKDADATSIYGSRGAGGVILITTKKGKIGRTTVGVNAYTGWGKAPHRIDLMNVHQYNAMRREALANDKITPTTTNAGDLLTWDSTKTTDWQKFFIGRASPTQDMEINLGGGNTTTRFNANVGYHNEGTTLPGNNMGATRKSARFNFDHNSTDGKFGVTATSAYSITTLNLLPSDLTSDITYAPDYQLYTPTGAPNWNGVLGFPLSYLLQPYNSQAENYVGHALLRYTPIKGLNIKLDAGFNNTQLNESLHQPASSMNPAYGQPATLILGNFYTKTWIAEPQMDYTVNVDRHHITALVGGTWQQNQANGFNAYATNFPNDALIGNLSSASTISSSTILTNYAYNSFFGRINYNWDERYLVNVNFRRDGSSRFGPGKRFGNFGAVAAGWIFTKEDFMKPIGWLSFGKLRASYGNAGNDQIQDYGYITTYGSGNLYQGSTTLVPNLLANPDFRWEQDRKLEVGLELGALKDRILLKSSFYRNRTDNMLMYYALSPQTGFSGYQANFPALLQNQGWEFELNTKNIVTKKFSWTSSFNFSWNHNKLLKYPGLATSSYATQYFIGKSILVRQAYQFNGLDSIGRPKFADRDHDGSITSKDRVIVGNTDPMFGGLTNTFDYRGFSLSFLWEYQRFRNFNNAIPSRLGGQGTNSTLLELNAWHKAGDEAHTYIPKYTTSSATYNSLDYSQSTVLWGTSNIFRLRNLSLSYSLPDELLKKAKIQRIQLYMLGQNLFVFDPLKKYRLDPETGNSGTPPLRIWTFGINCSF